MNNCVIVPLIFGVIALTVSLTLSGFDIPADGDRTDQNSDGEPYEELRRIFRRILNKTESKNRSMFTMNAAYVAAKWKWENETELRAEIEKNRTIEIELNKTLEANKPKENKTTDGAVKLTTTEATPLAPPPAPPPAPVNNSP